MYSKYQIIEILESCFQNMNCLSWVKLIPVLIHLKYWYFDSPYLGLPCLPHYLSPYLPCLPHQILPWATETPLQHNPHHVLHSVSLFCPPPFATMSCRYHVLPMSYPTRYHKYWIYQTIRQSNPIKFIVKLYPDHNTLWVKHATHQIIKFLRAASLSKWDNTGNSNSIFNRKHVEFFTKW